MSEKEREREGKKRQPTHKHRERERARNFFHEILASLVTKSYKKLSAKFRRKLSTFRSDENVQRTFFATGFLSCNPSARLKKLRWPVLIVKLKKGLKNCK